MQTVCVLMGALLASSAGQAGITANATTCPAPTGAGLTEAQAVGRYILHGAVVFDAVTQLSWQRCSVGQHWEDGHGCVGDIRFFSFDETQDLADGVWRIPTREELATLVDQGRVDQQLTPTIDPVAFPNLDEHNDGYWSSTPYNASQGWFVAFNAGDLEFSHRYRGYLFAVRRVCDGH